MTGRTIVITGASDGIGAIAARRFAAQFSSPVRSVWLDIPELVQAARQTRATGATEFCIVAAVRGPDARLMSQLRDGVKAIHDAVDIQVAASLGILSQEQAAELAGGGWWSR